MSKSTNRMLTVLAHQGAGNTADHDETKSISGMRPAGPGFVTDGLYLYSTRKTGPNEDQSDPMYLGLPP